MNIQLNYLKILLKIYNSIENDFIYFINFQVSIILNTIFIQIFFL